MTKKDKIWIGVIIGVVGFIIWMRIYNSKLDYKYRPDPSDPQDPPPRPFEPNLSEPTNQMMGAKQRNQVIKTKNMLAGKCSDPNFLPMDISGRVCAGTHIDENRKLMLGDQGCEVLLLQQRLNTIDMSTILEPNGMFNCETKRKLVNITGVPEIRLNDFQPDEQTGFNELQEGTNLTSYSYMDVDKKYKKCQ